MKKLILVICLLLNHVICHAQTISASQFHSLRLTCTATIPEAYGNDSYGQLANGTTTGNQNTPILVHSLSGITSVSAGGYFSLFLKNDGTVWACGGNANGQLGNGTTLPSDSPVQVSGLTNIISIAGGLYFSLFLKNDGTVWACGYNNAGQLGDGTQTPRTTPVQVIGLTGITAISAGFYHSLFLKNDGTVWACGANGNGELGDGTTTNKLTPVQVSGLTGISKISAGSSHSIFLKNDGTAWSTGRNLNGQLGDGTTTSQSTAVQVSGITSLIGIEAGNNHTLFLKSNGTAWSCGDNASGQLGDGTTINRLIPVQVNNISNISELSGGEDHSLFLQNNNVFWACGNNQYGKLGDGTFVDRLSPVQILDTGIPEINIKGNNVTIVDGDATPSASDHTNFGSVLVGNSASRIYTIENTGTGTLSIPLISSSNAMFTIGSVTPSSFILPGNSATIVVTFTPTSTGQKNGILTIENNDCDEMPYTFSIRGTGVTTCPTLSFNETHVEACYGTTDGSITISGSAGGAGPYSFSKDSGLTYQSGNTFSNLAPGIYQMRNKDMNGCESAALAVNVNDLTPPTIICPPVTTMFMDVYTNCGSNLPLPIMTDNCPFTYLLPATIAYRVNNGGTKTTTTNTGAMGDSLILAVDTNRIYWSITDFSGNTDSCVQTIILYDTIAPLYKPVFDNYAFETATGVMLEDLSIGATEIIPSGSDNVSSAVQQIPFYFDFHSVAYSDFSVSSNGLIGFGTTAVTTSAINSTSGGQHNKIYALWDNLHTGTNGSVKFKVVGTRPYRKLVIEFNVRNASETGNYTKTFQVWLFETSHKVQLVYGAGTNMPAATIGVRGANATVYNDVTSSNHTGSKRIVNDANTAWPGSGRSYIFTPAIFATASAGTCSANVVVQEPDFWECSQNFIAYSNYGTTYGTGFYANSYILLYNFPVGTTPLIYTVSDKYDSTIVNTATYSIPVIVEDTTLPVITCSGAQSFNTSPGLCTGAATVTPPTITDDCSSFAINNALNFDGMNDIVKVASTSVISTASQNKRTIEVSFKVNDKNISSQKQVIWEEGGSSNGLNMYVYNGSLYYGIYSVSNGWTGTWLSTPNIVNGQWHKAVLVYDSAAVTGRLIAYLDGTIVGSADSSATLGNALAIHNTGTNGIGALASNGRFHDGAVTLAEGHYFGGDIDELRIWNVARTPQELVSTGLSPLTGTETGLVLYYNFNQGAACGNNTGVNSLDDITATNVNGVVTNMTLNGSCVSNWTTGAPAYSNPITLTNSFNNTSDASGNYPIGTTNVIWTASDASGNEVTCTQAITVNDNQAPTLLAPSNQNLNVIANTCAANYTIADPFTDNCTGGTWGYSTTGATVLTSSGNTRNDGQSSGVLSFNKGTTIVTLTGTDGINIATSTTFTVTVTDNQAPTFLAPANQNLNVIANTCAANYTIADPFTDNCTGGTWGYSTTGATILTSSGNSRNDGQSSGVLSFNKGTTIVTLTGTDGSNAATSTTFTVTVTDNQAPTLVAPANQNLNVIANTCAANYTIADPFTDNCTGGTWGYSTTGATILTSSGNTRNDGQSSGVLSFNKGTTIVTLTGTDGSNAATSTTFTVTVTDNQAPTLLAPANQNLNVIANTCAANYTIADPFTDNCTGGTWGYSTTGATILTSSGNTRNDGQSSGVLSFNKGTTIVTLTGTDGTNIATSTTFTVTVNDHQIPTLSPFISQTINTVNCSAGNFTIPDPITDNCPGATWGYSIKGATVDSVGGIPDGTNSSVLSLNPGYNEFNLYGVDASGNTSLVHTRQILVSSPTCTQMVNLKALLQGFYIGDTTMAPVLLNQGVSASNLIADSISIQLSIAPPTMNGSTYYTLLNTDGSASFNIFPTPYKDYYIRIRHRNSIETWTSTPVVIGATTNYDFTSAASKAYGGNQIEVEPGIFAIYTGDINQDGVIDGLDFNDWENDSNNFSGGYFSTDLNGDGVVDGLDFIYWEQNSNNFVGAIMP